MCKASECQGLINKMCKSHERLKDNDTTNLLMNRLPRLRTVSVRTMFIFLHNESLVLKNKSQAHSRD